MIVLALMVIVIQIMVSSAFGPIGPYGVNFVEPDICELEWNRYGSPDNNLRY